MLVGARFVCPTCLRRDVSRRCARCHADALDLADDATPGILARTWSLVPAWRAGRNVLSPLAIRHDRRVLLLAAVLGAVVVGGALMDGGPPGTSGIEAVVAVGIAALVLAPVAFVVLAIELFYVAHLLRAVALLYMGLGAILPFVGLGLVFVGRGLDWMGAWLLPRVTLHEPPRDARTPRAAQLESTLVVRSVLDDWGWMEQRDAWLEPATLVMDGRTLRLELDAGSVTRGGATRRDGGPSAGGAYRDAPAAGEPPRWTQAPGRRNVVRVAEIPAGRAVQIRGGIEQDGVLRGTPEHPLALELG